MKVLKKPVQPCTIINLGSSVWNRKMDKSCILLCAALCVFVFVTAEEWSGNVCSRQDCQYVRERQCIYRTWAACCAWKYVNVPQYVTVNYCCPGWRESSSQNCNVPICNPPCQNGGTCTSPNVCRCPVQFQGETCGGPVCSHESPCFPGSCRTGQQCDCSSGFTTPGAAAQDFCLKIEENTADLRIYELRVNMSNIKAGVGMLMYSVTLDASNSALDIFYTNRDGFNRLEAKCSSQYFVPTIPPRPLYVSNYAFGVVYGAMQVWLLKLPPAGQTIYPPPSLYQTMNCTQFVSSKQPEKDLFECVIQDPGFGLLLEHGDIMRVTFLTRSGGFRDLINRNDGSSYRTQEYISIDLSLSVELHFDFRAPRHCAETNTCTRSETMLTVPDITRTATITITWNGWYDDDSKMGRYSMEVFKMTKAAGRELEIRSEEALKPLINREVNHTTDTSQYSQQYTLPEPGMYSVILEIGDRANNTKYVRRFVLYDPNPVITSENAFNVTSASAASNYTYQINHTEPITVSWDGHFRNALHEDNNLLGPVSSYPPELRDLMEAKAVYLKTIPQDRNQQLDDYEGARTIDEIPNERGIVNFQVAHATDSAGGSNQPQIPAPSLWTDLGLSTSFTLPLTVNPTRGDTVTIWVKAIDAIGAEKVERRQVSFDSTGPVVSQLDFRLNTNVKGIDFSSTFDLRTDDPESGIAFILWTFRRKNGTVIYTEQVVGKRVQSCPDTSVCFCTRGDVHCFLRDQSFPLTNCRMMVEKESLDTEVITVTSDVTNMAGLVTRRDKTINELTMLNGSQQYFPPQNIKVTEVTQESARVTWDYPPSCFARTGFWVIINDVKHAVHVDARDFVLTGLTPQTFYTIYLVTDFVGGEQSEKAQFTFATVTTTAPTTAQCPAGHFINSVDNGRCTQCAVGRYQERANQNDCKKCPAGSTTNTTGARDIQACRAPPQMKSTASVHLRYVLLVICTREDEVKTSSAVHARVVVMQSDWTGLCIDSACSNSHVTSTCEGPTSKIITSVIAFDDISPTLSSTNTSTTLPTNEALLQAILLRDTFNLEGITGAVLLKSDVSVTVTYSCRAGYVPSSDTCVAVSGGGISPELIGSIVGGCIGLIAVVLLVILVIRQFRKPRTQRQTDRPTTEHPYDSLTSSAVRKPYTDLNSPPVPHSWHLLDTCAPNRPISERKSESFPQQETVSDYDYLELQEATKHVYLTPAGMPATLQEMTSSPDQEMTPKPELPFRTGVTPLSDNHLKLEDATMDTYLTPVGMPATLQDTTSKSDHEMTSKPELPSRTGVTPLSDRQGRGDLGSNDTAVEMASAAPPDTTPTAHTLAAESDYITPIF